MAAPTLNSIPEQSGEVVRALIEVDSAARWYRQRRRPDGTLRLQNGRLLAGELTIAADPTPGEFVMDVPLTIGELRTNLGLLNILRQTRPEPDEVGFNSWMTGGRWTGDDGVGRPGLGTANPFVDNDPGLRYAVYVMWDDAGPVAEMPVSSTLQATSTDWSITMPDALSVAVSTASPAFAAGDHINFVIAYRSDYVPPRVVGFRDAVFAAETDQVFLELLTISHPELGDDIRVVNNMENVTSRDLEFIALPFQVVLPDASDDRPPRASLRIDNVSRQIIEHIRTVNSSVTVKIEVILASNPDVPEVTFDGFRLGSVEADAFTIRGDLVLEDLTVKPWPAHSFTPGSFPGMF